MEFWGKKLLISIIYLILIGVIYKFLPDEVNKIVGALLTTVFVWVMNKTFSIDYQTKNEKELKEYQKKIDKEMEDYKNEWNKKFEDYKNKLEAELETHKAKLSGYTLVTKLQFDLEFKIYTESYGMLINTFKRIFDLSSLHFEMQENININNEVLKNMDEFTLFVGKNSPFYSKLLYEKFTKISLDILKIIRMIPEYNNAGKIEELKNLKELDEIGRSCEEISSLIREQIEKMKIVE